MSRPCALFRKGDGAISHADAAGATARVIAPGGHLVTDRSEFGGSQQASRQRIEFVVFNGDVTTVEALQRNQVLPECPRVARRQPSLAQPAATQHVDCVMVILNDAVIGFEPFDHPDGRLGVRIRRGTQPWEKALLFVCGMPRGDRPEVVQSCSEDFAIGFRQRSSSPAIGNGQKHRQEPFDPAVALAQRPERCLRAKIHRQLFSLHECHGFLAPAVPI